MFNSRPFLGQVPLRPRNLGCAGGFLPAPEEWEEEPSAMMGCYLHENEEEGVAIGCAKCKKKKKTDWSVEEQPPSEMVGTFRTERHGIMAGTPLGQNDVCPARPPIITAEMNCQRTETGSIICSNNVIYSATCPNSPPANYPGVAPNMPGTNIPKAPPYKGAEDAPPSNGGVTMPSEPATSSLPVVGLVAGGLAVAGLAYLVFAR